MHKFESVLAPYMEQLIAYKGSLNITIRKYETVCHSIDRYFVENHITSTAITKEIVYDWLEQATANNSIATKSIKMSVMRALCMYMAKIGIQDYIPRFSQKDQSTYVPYIFSKTEIQSIFEACDSWKIKGAHKENGFFAMPAIIRLLYGTGMRISEVTQLTNEDVDLKTGSILINRSKNNKQRMIPISDTLLPILSQYRKARNRLPYKGLNAPNHLFFVSASNIPYDKKNVYYWFRIILERAGIEHKGKNYGPRIHDFRHTFAVHSLIQSIESGEDVYCTLPILSVFLGHSSIYSTEKYVRLTKDTYPDLMKQINDAITDIFPHLDDSFTNEDED